MALFVIYLIAERIILSRRSRVIPRRICVTGIRGKSSVTRLIAASLKEAGFSVLAKTTGTKPVIIFPDGEEEEIVRRGLPSILEGKKILKQGAELHVQALVSEIMSIHPEVSFAESVQMMSPQILVITNVRLDHLAEMGSSKEEIARSLAASIPERSTVFIPEAEFFRVFEEKAKAANSRLIQVPENSLQEYFQSGKKLPSFEFQENISLSLAVIEFLGIDRGVALQGMAKAQPDFGRPRTWSADRGSPPYRWHFVSVFAANDPESTRFVLDSVQEKMPLNKDKMVGLLNLRRDRGDRTLQWFKALKEGAFPEFQRLFFIGDHTHALKRRLKLRSNAELFVLKEKSPERVMEKISGIVKGEAVLVGMGNMGGIGREIVDYWERVGESYDL
ncbi:MAG: poly-gamma-glutamate synthase PgsB [Candidatus Aminicenantes bacterium]|nr:MAG: poly-gamma-glutamate synthase PgsB [Candidatus Aminicenantes bacterium]